MALNPDNFKYQSLPMLGGGHVWMVSCYGCKSQLNVVEEGDIPLEISIRPWVWEMLKDWVFEHSCGKWWVNWPITPKSSGPQ